MNRKELLKKIDEKYNSIGINPDVMLEGLLHGNPIKYWDYVQTDALLGLQIQRTDQPDEMVFIMYHQINELLFKMILWEIDQVADEENITVEKFVKHLTRISRYFDMLSKSFDIMGDGMDIDQYMKFRNTLTPASGFQSAQYRMIEVSSTELINLIDYRFRNIIDRNTPFEYAFEYLYWQAAGKVPNSDKKSPMLHFFEEKYKVKLLRAMRKYNQTNLWAKFKLLPTEVKNDLDLINAMRHYDWTVNISWVMAHYDAAGKYLGSGDEEAEATGGSDWRKYMHPKYQRRIFFPDLWTEEELKSWGITNLKEYEILKELPKRVH